MRVVVHGEPLEFAQTIILGIHGWGGGAETFEPLVPYIAEGVCLVSVDLPGYGGSSPPATWSVDAVATELVDVIDGLPGELTLLGNCSGAIFGMCAVLKRPQRFGRMVLIDPFAYFPWYFQIMLWPWVGRIFYATAFQNPLGRLLTNLGLAHRRSGESNLTSSFGSLNHDVVYEYLRLLNEVGGYRGFSGLSSIRDVELAIGEKSFQAIHQSAQLWKSLWPQAEVKILKGAGHLPIEEAPRQLGEVIFKEREEIA